MAKRESKKSRPRRSTGQRSSLERLYEAAQRYSWPITIVLLLAILVGGLYLRVLPALHYKLELDASDPWIEYWMAKYFVDHGLFDFSGLRDVKIFWYPEGRDFIRNARIGVPWLTAATYPIAKHLGLTLKEWISLVPPIAGAIGVIVSFGFAYRLTRSKLGGLVAAALYSLSPGAITRTSVGFVEKIGVAFPVLVIALWLFVEATRASERVRRMTLAFLAGLVAGLIGFLWGGYALALAAFVIVAIIEPLLLQPEQKRFIEVYLPLSLGAYIALAVNPSFGPLYITRIFGLLAIAPAIAYGIALALKEIATTYNWRLHLWLIVAIGVLTASLLLSGYGGIGGRVMAALGAKKVSPLVASVQEHAPAPWSTVFREYGVALILTIIGLFFEAYALRRGTLGRLDGAVKLSVYIMAVLLLYANKNMSYFTEMAASMNSLAAGIFAGSIIVFSDVQKGLGRKARRIRSETDQLQIAMALAVIVIVVAGVAVSVNTAYTLNAHKAPSIMTSMLGPMSVRSSDNKTKLVAPINGAWINALNYIKNATPPDALIISWWDYGYWITVNTNRTTVADGATINETQIRILARILTGTEDGASALLKTYFHAEPNNTYIVFYEVFYVIYDNGTMRVLPMPRVPEHPQTDVYIIHGAGDLPKSFQMLKIGYRIDPFAASPFGTLYSTTVYRGAVAYHHFPGFVGEPESHRNAVYNALLYRLMVDGLYHLNNGLDKFILDNGCEEILAKMNTTHPIVIPSVLETEMTAASLMPVQLHRFTLANMSIGCPANVASIDDNRGTMIMVIVFIYKWTG